MFLPTTYEEVKAHGWNKLDIILVTGDTYIDSPFMGAAVIGKVLLQHGYRVGIISQPCIDSSHDIARLGEPLLFWGVTSGSVDSMVANYTATGKYRKLDDFTPGGLNTRRPDRAVIAYANLIRRFFKTKVPVVIGGIEASLRRVPHYDYHTNSIRRSILFDAKADILIYGMGEKAVVLLAESLKNGKPFTGIKGICYISKIPEPDFIQLDPYELVTSDPIAFSRMFQLFHLNNDPMTANGLCQKHGSRYLIHNPPAHFMSEPELDAIYDLDYERDIHPYYKKLGAVRALETIRFSITTHRGCIGECNFCTISVHQGRMIKSRSQASILREVEKITHHKAFNGIISDVGGPTANMYGFECKKIHLKGLCKDKRCLYPGVCKNLRTDHGKQIDLLMKIRNIKGVRHVFVASGIRHDIILADKKNGLKYLTEVVFNHTSGQMKIAPEHTEDEVVSVMGKPGKDSLLEFKLLFDKLTEMSGKNLYLTYYLMAAHPGCTETHMNRLKAFILQNLRFFPEQVQIFTPTPSTISTLIYHTGFHPETGKIVFSEKEKKKKERQKKILMKK